MFRGTQEGIVNEIVEEIHNETERLAKKILERIFELDIQHTIDLLETINEPLRTILYIKIIHDSDDEDINRMNLQLKNKINWKRVLGDELDNIAEQYSRDFRFYIEQYENCRKYYELIPGLKEIVEPGIELCKTIMNKYSSEDLRRMNIEEGSKLGEIDDQIVFFIMR